MLRELRELERVIGTTPIKASCRPRRGRPRRGRRRARAGAGAAGGRRRCIERCGAPYETAQARLELAATLTALGRHDRAEAETAAATSALRVLGAKAAAEPLVTAARTGGARTARGRIDESPDRRRARPERAHRPPARCEHPAQARRAFALGGRSSCGSRRSLTDSGPRHRRRRWPVLAKSTRSDVATGRGAMEDQTAAPSTVWALGDYHRFAKEMVWGVGRELGGRLRGRIGAEGARRRCGHRQRRNPCRGGRRRRRRLRPDAGKPRGRRAGGSPAGCRDRVGRRRRAGAAVRGRRVRRRHVLVRRHVRGRPPGASPTSCCGSAGPAARSGWRTSRPRAASASSSASSRPISPLRRKVRYRRCSGATRATCGSSSVTASLHSS